MINRILPLIFIWFPLQLFGTDSELELPKYEVCISSELSEISEAEGRRLYDFLWDTIKACRPTLVNEMSAQLSEGILENSRAVENEVFTILAMSFVDTINTALSKFSPK